MCEPLPLYCKTSAAWAAAHAAGKDPERAAAGSWESNFNFDQEDREAEHILVLGDALSFEAMVQCGGAPRHDEAVDDGWPAGSTRFEVYAHRLWDGLLEHEEIVDR